MTLLAVDAWGRCGWTLIHACSFAFPDSPTHLQRTNMHRFLWSIADVLPCVKCRKHLEQQLSDSFPSPNAPALQSRKSLTTALNELHNSVNRDLGKPEMTYDDMCAQYKEPSAGVCTASASSNVVAHALFYFIASLIVAAICVWTAGRLLKCRLLGQCEC